MAFGPEVLAQAEQRAAEAARQEANAIEFVIDAALKEGRTEDIGLAKHPSPRACAEVKRRYVAAGWADVRFHGNGDPRGEDHFASLVPAKAAP